MRWNKQILGCSALLMTLVLAACGGGGGAAGVTVTQSLDGVALTGAPLKSATVTITDSAGKDCATTTTGSDGKWSADLKNCGAAPYLIKAAGTENGVDVTFFSAATQDDVNTTGGTIKPVNISQITDAIVKVALKTDTPTSPTGLTTDTLKTASVKTLEALIPADVRADAGIDLTKDVRTMTVVAGSSTGLDKLHDRVPKVIVSNDPATNTLGIVATVGGYASTPGGTDKTATSTVGVTLSTTQSAATPTAATTVTIGGTAITTASAATLTPTVVSNQSPADRAKGELALLLAAYDSKWASAVPDTAEKLFQHTDGCYLEGGRDKALSKTLWEEDKSEFNAQNTYRVGATRTNLRIDTIQALTSATGKAYRVAKIRYDITFNDGTTAFDTEHTMIFGDSSNKCSEHGLAAANAQDLPTWRFLGDGATGEKIQTVVEAHNRVTRNYNIVDGIERTANKTVQNRLDFFVSDPRNLGFTYAIIKGPSLPNSGVKFVFAAVYNSTSNELSGKSGNYLNNTSRFDTARICSASSTSWNADTADCAGRGLGSYFWTQSDIGIAALPANATYTYDIYNDDGWKTVNGQAGKTPVLTYSRVLKQKPLTTAYLEASYPTLTPTLTTQEYLALAKASGGTFSGTLTAATTPAGEKQFVNSRVWVYSQGAKDAVNLWPVYRQIQRSYLKKADTTFSLPFLGLPTGANRLVYTEGAISSTDRNGRVVETVYQFN